MSTFFKDDQVLVAIDVPLLKSDDQNIDTVKLFVPESSIDLQHKQIHITWHQVSIEAYNVTDLCIDLITLFYECVESDVGIPHIGPAKTAGVDAQRPRLKLKRLTNAHKKKVFEDTKKGQLKKILDTQSICHKMFNAAVMLTILKFRGINLNTMLDIWSLGFKTFCYQSDKAWLNFLVLNAPSAFTSYSSPCKHFIDFNKSTIDKIQTLLTSYTLGRGITYTLNLPAAAVCSALLDRR